MSPESLSGVNPSSQRWGLSFLPSAFLNQLISPFQCLKSNCLVLLEDLDTAESGVVTSVMELSERRDYPLPNGCRSKINKQCRVVATMRSDDRRGPGSSRSGGATALLRNYPYTIELNEFTTEEMGAVALAKFPTLSTTMKDKLLEMFTRLCSLVSSLSFKSSIERQPNIKYVPISLCF